MNRVLLENCAPEVALGLVEPIAGETYSWIRRSKPGITQAGQGRKRASRIVGLCGVGLGREPRGLGAGLLLILVTVEPCGWSRPSFPPLTGTVTNFQRPEAVQQCTLP